MKSKKLLTLLVILAALVAVIIILAAVFAVAGTTLVFHDAETGVQIATPDDAPSVNEITTFAKGKSIFLLSKDKLLDKINSEFTAWHAVDAVKLFPNKIEIHFVRRIAVCKLTVNGADVFIDTFGYVFQGTPPAFVINITSAFSGNFTNMHFVAGEKPIFSADSDNQRLLYILDSINAVWRMKYSYAEIPFLVSGFAFTADNSSMTLTTKAGAYIIVASPSKELTERLIKAFGVYYNNQSDLQQAGKEIFVTADGKIITDSDN